MASSYTSSRAHNDSSGGSSPFGSPASSSEGLLDDPVADTGRDSDSDGNSLWGPPASEYGLSSEGDPIDLVRDDEDEDIPVHATTRQASPFDDITSGVQPVEDQSNVPSFTDNHTSLHLSDIALVPSASIPLVYQPSQQPAAEAHEPTSETAQSTTTPSRGHTTSSATGLKTTPVAKKFSTMQTSSSFESRKGPSQLYQLRMEFASEMKGRVARTDVDTFMREFVPGTDLPEDTVVDALDSRKFSGTEAPIYGELLKLAKSVFRNVTDNSGNPTFVAKDTHGFSDPSEKVDGGLNRAPDLTVYPCDKRAAEAYTLTPSDLSKHLKPFASDKHAQEKNLVARTVWHWASLLFEVKSKASDSPFNKPKPVTASDESRPAPAGETPPPVPFSRSPAIRPSSSDIFTPPPAPWTTSGSGATPIDASEYANTRLQYTGAEKTLGQLTEHAYKVMRRGSRLCVFTVFVCLENAWLLRWDRAGVVVSEPFNLLEQPRVLPNFLYRFARMTDEQRGLDPTVTFASKEEAQLLHSIPQSGIETAWQKMAYANTRQKDWPVYTITIPEDDFVPPSRLTSDPTSIKDRSKPSRDGPRRKLVVGKAHFTSESITGRGTKCYLAYDVTDRRAVFCKEYWRVDLPTSHAEGDVYVDLHQHGVEFIPTPIAAGDVRYGETSLFSTCTQEFLPDDSGQPRLILYRLLLKEIAEPLETYRNSRQLVSALFQCIVAHEQAWTKAKILHRDISVNNILIYRYRSGGKIHWIAFLVDWAFCKYEHELGLEVVQKTRSGTWHFMSAVLLFFPGHFVHAVWHDLEAFIHSLHWMCLRFHKTDYITPKTLRNRVCDLYAEADRRDDGVSYGGHAKLKVFSKGLIPFDLRGGSVDQPQGLHSLLIALSDLYGEQYAWLQAESMLPTIDDAADEPLETDAAQGATEDQEEELDGVPLEKFEFVDDAPAAPIIVQQPLPKKPEPVLDHRRVKLAFQRALQGPGTWSDDPKSVTDRFALFDGFTLQSRSSVKRSSDGSSDRKGKRNSASKATASGTETPQTSRLGSIGEQKGR